MKLVFIDLHTARNRTPVEWVLEFFPELSGVEIKVGTTSTEEVYYYFTDDTLEWSGTLRVHTTRNYANVIAYHQEKIIQVEASAEYTVYNRYTSNPEDLSQDHIIVYPGSYRGRFGSLVTLAEENNLFVEFSQNTATPQTDARIATDLVLELPKVATPHKKFADHLVDLFRYYDTKGIPYVIKNGKPSVLT